jgi:glycosyltransferase involved in cell wall biosynthesis
MLISVVIPNYNHAKYLVQRIESVLNQTYQDFEVIILDDCSSDNSREIIEQYKEHPKVKHIIYNGQNSGSTFKQWNKGFNLAKGEWIWIAESDDKAKPDFLEKLVPNINSDPDLGIVYCESFKVNEEDEITGSWRDYSLALDKYLFHKDFKMKGLHYIERFLVHRNTIPNASAVLINKKCYLAVEGVDENIRNCSDWLLWLKILLISNVYYVAQPLNYFRYHEKSVIAKALKNRESDQYYELYDRSMRKVFHQLILTKFSQNLLIKNILKSNQYYIVKDNGIEGIFDIDNKKWLTGFKKVITSLFAIRSKSLLGMAVKQLIINKLK